MKHHKSAEPSQRQLRAGELIRHIVAQTMQRGHFGDEVLLDAGQITVSEVRCSPDLKNATAYVMSLGGQNMDAIIPALNNNSQVFQKDINRESNLKFTPKIRFKVDDSFTNAQNIEDLLRGLNIPKDDEEE
ncbi:30S ribosome-binding factor RbfA [Alphaproteobacteria bacterium]|nr:30S ribosome-binding factor RbfA [Alphaproteobacteria bacterium]